MTAKEKNIGPKHNISELGLRSKRYLLFVGSLTKREGAHYLIEAFKQLEDTAKTPNNFKLAIAANGDEVDDEDYVKYLKTISERRDNIIFFCARKKSTIKQLFSSAYLYVQPAEIVLAQDTLMEAMGYGLAPLVSDAKENVKVVGSNGFFFKAKSVLNLRDRLAYLLSRSEEVSVMSERSKKRAQKYLEKKAVLNSKVVVEKEIILEKNIWKWKNLLKKN